ncbi:hypothetical protein Zmor_025615 [Zophobas morio]|uniref:O-acyltransferase n=1 Tax=Zophobas morio TaxID=2755281 RepID=A0AA38HTJ7_9CUCU|nr:hypothetical protein Zmor_025615 [Zophobas morio]
MESTRKKNNVSKEKDFIERNSLLTDLFEDKHIRTVYNMFLAIFIGLFFNTVTYDYIKRGEINLGVRLIKIGFGKIHIVIITWLSYILSSCLVFCCFNIWAKFRTFRNKQHTKIWDRCYLTLLVLYYVGSFKLAENIVTTFKLPICSAAIVIVEQVRLLMKIHSFVRTKTPHIINTKRTDDKHTPPTFSNFLYFLFIPTLLYRDSYPRKDKIDWTFAAFKLLEFVGAIFFFSFVIERFLNPSLQDFGLREYQLKELILILFENTITGIFILMLIFFIILHSCQNFFAEITKFGDRMFYSDWWTCTSYGGYFRKWNIVVQDWLYVYIYKEFMESFGTSAAVAKFGVIVISAVVHEWCLTHALGFFFPLLFVEFVVLGSILGNVEGYKNIVFNVIFWYSLAIGMSSLCTFYTIEYYARNNAPIKNPTFLENIVPRFITCDCID